MNLKSFVFLASAFAASFAASAEETTSALVGGAIPGVPTYSLSMPDAEPSTDGAIYWDALSVFDGDASTRMDDYAYYGVGSARGVVGFDAGTPRHVTGLRIRQTSGYGDRNQKVKLLGSNDGADWTTVVENTGTVVSHEAFTELAAVEGAAKYRYFKIADSVVNDLTDVEIVSDDALVKADAPQAWASATVGAADHADGVLVSGTLVYASGEATLVAYAARKDYGDDLAAWQQSGTALALGTATTGGTFSGRFAGLAAGTYYWRVFATVGGVSYASQTTRPFTVGSATFLAPAYMNTSEWWNAYDGSTDSQADNSACTWMVFDCSGVAAREFPVALRFWPRTDGRLVWNRLRGLRVEVSFDAHQEPSAWGGSEATWADRVRYTNATEPEGLTWTEVGNGEIFTDPISGIEELVLPKYDCDNKPTYVRIRNVYWGNLREVELRTRTRPNHGLLLIVR